MSTEPTFDLTNILRLVASMVPWHKRIAEMEDGTTTTVLALDTAEEDGLDPKSLRRVGRLVTENLRGLDADEILTCRAAIGPLAHEVVRLRADLGRAVLELRGLAALHCPSGPPSTVQTTELAEAVTAVGREMEWMASRVAAAVAHANDAYDRGWLASEQAPGGSEELRLRLAKVEAERDTARAEADAFAIYRSLVTTALGIDPASCADDVREAIEVLRSQNTSYWFDLVACREQVEQDRAAILRLTEERNEARAEVEELRLTLAAEQGKPEGAPSEGWEYGIIDEEGGLGWRKPTADGMLFAWGAGIDFLGAEHTPDPHPGGWTRWVADEDGDLDEMPECMTDETWTARAAMIAADKAPGGA